MSQLPDRLAIVEGRESGHSWLVGERDSDGRGRCPGLFADGTVMRVPSHADGTLDWGRASPDLVETARRQADAIARLDRLAATDPGGDVEL